jgi:ribosomal protein L37AE/L43A
VIEVEKIPNLECEVCGSFYVTMTEKGIECDNCDKITANTSDWLKEKNNKLTLKYGENK